MCALIKTSAAISAISGKSGGNVFSRNASGAYLKAFTVPVNPNTSKQQAIRTSFAGLVASWKNLSKAQQQAWKDMAPQYPYVNRLGDTKTYTGQQLYIHLNQNLALVGTAALSTPLVPETFSSIKLDAMSMVLTAGILTTGELNLSAAGAANEAVIAQVTTSMSGGITAPPKSAFKQVQVFADASLAQDLDITASYITLYGSPQLSTNIFSRVWMINKNTGQRINLGQAVTTVSGT